MVTRLIALALAVSPSFRTYSNGYGTKAACEFYLSSLSMMFSLTQFKSEQMRDEARLEYLEKTTRRQKENLILNLMALADGDVSKTSFALKWITETVVRLPLNDRLDRSVFRAVVQFLGRLERSKYQFTNEVFKNELVSIGRIIDEAALDKEAFRHISFILIDYLSGAGFLDPADHQMMAIEGLKKMAERTREDMPKEYQRSIENLEWVSQNSKYEHTVQELAGSTALALRLRAH